MKVNNLKHGGFQFLTFFLPKLPEGLLVILRLASASMESTTQSDNDENESNEAQIVPSKPKRIKGKERRGALPPHTRR